MADIDERQAAKPRKPKAGKALKPQAVGVSRKVKSTIHLTVEASQRLDVHCSMARMDRSAMVEKLINDHLRRYVVSDRGGASEAAGEGG